MTEVAFPALSKGSATAEGVVATWFVVDGETVQVDKVAAEVPAPHAGVVHLLVKEDTAITQGTPIARID